MRKVITVLGTQNLLLVFLKNRLTEWVLSLRIEMEYAANLSHVRLIGRSLLVFLGQFDVGVGDGEGFLTVLTSNAQDTSWVFYNSTQF